ncbi:MAG: gamma-glutamyl-gamma-aminobutyrate hydrolase family protein [Solirubrobacterales bacterium]|nr:gamma-glutamyl-gamma-aminobutyrate hydrolase family protein [Solirubrobacterales bacterium]
MSRRPRILITPWRRAVPTYLGERTVLDALDPAYAGRVVEAGGLPLIASRPPKEAAELVAELLDLADGLLVSGGGDVDPATYGSARENVQDEEPAADAWELELLRGAGERGLPTLAICRGAQLLAVAHGGALAQHLPAALGHRELESMTADEILSARHPVTIRPGSRLHRALGADSLEVNTIHHHAIADPGDLEVTATAAGGVIEAIEPRGPWPALGVQWHPEKMEDPVQRALFIQLVERAREAAGVPA